MALNLFGKRYLSSVVSVHNTRDWSNEFLRRDERE